MPGSRSPLGALTLAQARALERELARSGAPLPVFVGMRNWHPFLHETLADMTARGVKRALGIILSPLRTEASWERYQQDVTDARAKVGGAPEVTFARAWYDHPRFIEARSEEHTSELQSRLHLVCRLLLEKKKRMNESVATKETARANRKPPRVVRIRIFRQQFQRRTRSRRLIPRIRVIGGQKRHITVCA